MDDDMDFSRWYRDHNVLRRVTKQLCHSTPITSEPGKPMRKTHYNPQQRHDEAMVCLTCARSYCLGEAKCYEARKKRMEEENKK